MGRIEKLFYEKLTIMELVLIIDVDQMGNNYNTVAVKGI